MTLSNVSEVEKILSAMRIAGRMIIDGTADHDSVAKHIEEISTWGYDGEIHSDFSNFVLRHIRRTYPITKIASEEVIRHAGEILVDYIVLEAARKLTMNDRLHDHGRILERKEFVARLPFVLPRFDLDARPYTPAASTFTRLCGHNVEKLADSGKYDDIFGQILLWRSYYKEPFHRYYYDMDIRDMSGYRCRRNLAIKEDTERKIKNFEQETKRRQRAQERDEENNRNRLWRDNTVRDLPGKAKRKKTAVELEAMPVDDMLAAIANSEYLLDYYYPWCYRNKWTSLFVDTGAVQRLDDKSRALLRLKMKGRKYLGWDALKQQL